VAGIDGVKITYQTQVPLYANHIRFQGCEIRNAPENGILITTYPNTTEQVYYNEILGCLIHNNGYNTGNGFSGHGIYSQASFSIIVRNNISYANNGASDYMNMGAATTADHNLFGVDPLFVNPTANNFHLQAGSPAIDAGITLSQVPVDFDSITRPQGKAYDI